MDQVFNDSDTWEMVNLVPKMTGLPMTVWAQPRGRLRHDVRIKVHKVHGPRMSISNTAVVGVRPVPHLVKDWLKPKDQQYVFRWVALNEAALIDYWEFAIDTGEFLQRLKPLSPPILP